MNEEILKKINAKEEIIKKLNIIIEAFVTFYGESERDRITNCFKNMEIICFCKPEDMALTIENSEIQKLEDMTVEFINKINIKNIDKIKLKKILFDDITEYDCISTLDSYIDYLDGNKERKTEVINLLNKFYQGITEDNLDKLINSKTFIEIDNILPLYNELIKTCKEFILSTKDYKKYLKKCSELKDALAEKYTRILLSELKEILPKEFYLKLEEEYNLNIQNNNADNENLYINKHLLPTLIETFSEKYNKMLDKEIDYITDYIQNGRMLYFKKIGINLGDNYSVYEKDENLKRLIPNQKSITLLTKKREELYLRMKEEYYSSLPEYQLNREKIDSLKLLEAEDGYDVSAYEEEATMIVPNIRKLNNKYIIYPLVLIYIGSDDGYLDSYIIHELNHVIETSLKNFDGKNFQMINGWEKLTGMIDKTKKITDYEVQTIEEKREYELFSETINEIISQNITRILFELDGYIFNNENNALIENGTNYEHMKFLVKEFYETYKKEIIESRKNGNIQIIYDTVGKENFEDLNKLFHIYYQYFPGETILDLYEELKEEIQSKKTKIYQELKIKRDKILSNMKEYYKNNKTKKLSV